MGNSGSHILDCGSRNYSNAEFGMRILDLTTWSNEKCKMSNEERKMEAVCGQGTTLIVLLHAIRQVGGRTILSQWLNDRLQDFRGGK